MREDALADEQAGLVHAPRHLGERAILLLLEPARQNESLNESLARKSMIELCSCPLLQCGAAGVLDVARTHHFAIAKRVGNWEVVE